MNPSFRRCTTFLAAAAACCAAFLLASPALAADRLHLKDGRVLEGDIRNEGETFVQIAVKIGGIEQVQLILKEDISKIERDEDAAPKPQPAAAPAGAAPASAPRDAADDGDGPVRIAFIQLGSPPQDMVGTYMNAEALEKSIEMLEDDKPDIVVLHINSGGGYGFEVEKLSDVIEEEIKPKYRTVAWIQSAISAAAMTAITIPEIYFMPTGNFGAATGFRMLGSAKAIEGEELEQMLYQMEKISARGGYDPLIMRAMQIESELSADIDENGVITWRNDLNGRYIVNPTAKARILTFNAEDAMKFRFAKGVAANRTELARLLVGDNEWVEVGQDANQYQSTYREATRAAELGVNELGRKYQIAVGQAQAAAGDPKERNRHVGAARQLLGQLRSLARRSSGVSFYMLPDDWFRQQEEILRRLAAGEPVNIGG